MNARVLLLAFALALGGCTLFPGGGEDPPRNVYLLAPELSPPAAASDTCGSIQVASGTGASGFRTAKMAYMRSPHQLEYFAWSVWADNPARMLGEAVREHLYASGTFAAVVGTPAATATDLRLDLGDARVLQRFTGEQSKVEITLEARVFATQGKRLSARRFRESEPASPDPAGGVSAANKAAGRLIASLYDFAVESCAPAQRPAGAEDQLP